MSRGFGNAARFAAQAQAAMIFAGQVRAAGVAGEAAEATAAVSVAAAAAAAALTAAIEDLDERVTTLETP